MEYGVLDHSTAARTASVHIVRDHECMSQLAAQSVLAALARLSAESGTRPLRVVLSGGRTPIRTYGLLATEYLGAFDWSTIHLYQMDEYVDATNVDDDYGRFLIRHVVKPLQIRKTYLFDRAAICASDNAWPEAIEKHERSLIDAGGIDLVVHGIGVNGHLGFNEPGSESLSGGRQVFLSASTRQSMQSTKAPTLGVTLGLPVLLAARESILLASGPEKATAVARALTGPISSDCPASWLRTVRRSSIILDELAAEGLAQ